MRIPFRRALISVYDKTRVGEMAQALAAAGCEILSTGSTAGVIREAGVPVTDVSAVTGFPESFDGRVKTLHPLIHGAILARRDLESHREQMEELGIAPIDLVVVNLYPFEQTVASGASVEDCIEKIDIGGPAMIRAAAKNHQAVAVVVGADQYARVAEAAGEGGFDDAERVQLAARAFATTAAYDAAIAQWTSSVLEGAELPRYRGEVWELEAPLRYGENPHQAAALYTRFRAGTEAAPTLARAQQLHGKAMSFNNYQDIDAAIRAAYDYTQPAVAVVKHANPCGIAVGEDIAAAHRRAHACDPVSAYGGVIAANREVTLEMAQQVKPIFTEVIAAPSYAPEALELLETKKNLRILVVEEPRERGIAEIPRDSWESRRIAGGLLAQERDVIDAEGDAPEAWELVAGEAADPDTLADLEFAWRAVRSVKSNAILLARGGASVGIGMGQVNRVDSCHLAVERANTLGEPEPEVRNGTRSQVSVPERARGAVAASDAFFPFADGFQVLADAGVKAVVQPGGSIRDAEVIEAAQAAGVTMYLTHARHFAH